ncbi:MAG: hypothetical protein LBO00_10465 [Zoogloeaceae bacterium]|jgi:type IV pilus assembly protein PilY1|nr:hypothetical protein [Zoogloeaceae bacterium]
MKTRILSSTSRLPRFTVRRLTCAVALALAPLGAQALEVSQTPLFAGGGGSAANLLYMHDDSSSMYWSFMPDGVVPNADANGAIQLTRPDVNKIYYDPNMTYTPPVDHNGNSLGNSNFNAAWFDGYDLAGRDAAGDYCSVGRIVTPRKVNLASQYRPTYFEGCYYKEGHKMEFLGAAAEAYYHDPRGNKITIPAAQRQNFANWYSYYRTRNYAARAGVSRAFADLPGNTRVGWGSINGERKGSPLSGPKIEQGVQTFTGEHKKAFYDWLFKVNAYGNTPLRPGLYTAGKYYEGVNPWMDDPVAGTGQLGTACRKSFTILMTDGYYDGTGFKNIGNLDGASADFTTPVKADGITTETWSTAPYADKQEDTLADIAWDFWSRDLHPSQNQVAGTKNDPAWWQHMTTYTIGFGLTGEPDKASTFRNAKTGARTAWKQVDMDDINSPTKVNDMLHAAVNGHGDFFSAGDTQEFINGMREIVRSIKVSINAVAPLAASSTSLRSDTRLFQATLDGEDWSGNLQAFPVDAKGNVAASPSWSAAIPAHNARKIHTWNPETAKGVNFAWTSLSIDQQTLLGSADLVDYLRGDTAREEPNGTYRSRNKNRMGDIVNSAPLHVGSPATNNYGYGYYSSIPTADRTSYQTRRTAATQRSDVVYVGANDGMLHAFDANTGAELFAYVPNGVFGHLPALADPGYTHRYYVDGSPNAGDILIGSDWKTLLVGSTGAGGTAYFALDVENPASFCNDNVLWEISDASSGFEHLGATIGQASIVRLNDGTWAAVFGNGYASADEKASLFIVNAATGALIKEISVGLDTDTDSNGLSIPLLIDLNRDGSADVAYAGDLLGRLWKFDLTSTSNSSWELAFSGEPLLVANDASGNAQPITAKPQAIRHADGAIMVYVGTGSFFATGDNVDTSIQTFYGIHDDGTHDNITRDSLVQQTLTYYSDTTGEYRFVSENTVDYATKSGFYIDLNAQGQTADGERLISTPIVWEDRVIFNTLIPSGNANACTGGGMDGWLMEIDPFSGARTPYSVFDLNSDGLFNNADYKNDGTGGKVVNGTKVGSGSGFTPIGVDKYGLNSGGKIQKIANSPVGFGRQSWKQIR